MTLDEIEADAKEKADKIKRYKALPPRHRAFVAVRTLRDTLNLDVTSMAPRELTIDEILKIEHWAAP
jgi:hypothetical protein